ncbi:MAG: hypothetical protein WCT40_03845 [Candidatus Magasanikbacteria bacterium]|jgi:hypothetical protein
MKIIISKSKAPDAVRAIRRCGYGQVVDRRAGTVSYARRMSAVGLYPRFHVYIDNLSENWSFNLHLDQKAAIYEGVTAHSGEYDGEVVEREGERITQIINGATT